ncbi:MAG: hypothetical protein ACT4PV_05755 [Planctomycetaceae bacterium]
MRFLALPALLALLSTPAAADPLVVVSKKDLDGTIVGLTALRRGESHTLAALVSRGARTEFWIVDTAARSVAVSTIAGAAGGLCSQGERLLAFERRGATTLLHRTWPQGRGWTADSRGLAVGSGGEYRLLGFGGDDSEALLCLAEGANLYLAVWNEAGVGRVDFLARPGRKFLAATRCSCDVDRDGKPDFFVAAEGPSLLRFGGREGGGWDLTQDYPYKADGFVPSAVVATPGRIWVAGRRGDDAAVFLLDPDARPSVHKFKDIFKDDATGKRDPVWAAVFGKGELTCISALGEDSVAVAGMRDGKAWIGVIDANRGRLLHETILAGGAIRELVVNPTRAGWSLAARADGGSVYFLRIPGDAAAPRDRTDPDPEPDSEADIFRPEPGAEAGRAVFPRLEMEVRRAIDAELFTLNLGQREARLVFKFYDGDGRLVDQYPGTLASGRRARVLLSTVFARRRIVSFDGYLVIEGARASEVVIEAVQRRPDALETTLQPHWR